MTYLLHTTKMSRNTAAIIDFIIFEMLNAIGWVLIYDAIKTLVYCNDTALLYDDYWAVVTKYKHALVTTACNILPLYYLLLIFTLIVNAPIILIIVMFGGIIGGGIAVIGVIAYSFGILIVYSFGMIIRQLLAMVKVCWYMFTPPTTTIPTNITQPHTRYTTLGNVDL